MSTPAASTKSLSSTSADAQNATSEPKSPALSNQSGTQKPAQNSTEQNDTAQNDADQNGAAQQNEGYPEQKHAGAVGLGPEYWQMREPTTGDKLMGLKDEIVGKLTHNPDKVELGREMRSGELKKKKMQEAEDAGPFAKGGDDKSEKQKDGKGGHEHNGKPQSAQSGDNGASGTEHDQGDNVAGNAAPTSVTGKRGPGTHPTETGAKEQAATVAPEGTEAAEEQRRGEVVNKDKQIDESSSKKPRTD